MHLVPVSRQLRNLDRKRRAPHPDALKHPHICQESRFWAENEIPVVPTGSNTTETDWKGTASPPSQPFFRLTFLDVLHRKRTLRAFLIASYSVLGTLDRAHTVTAPPFAIECALAGVPHGLFLVGGQYVTHTVVWAFPGSNRGPSPLPAPPKTGGFRHATSTPDPPRSGT